MIQLIERASQYNSRNAIKSGNRFYTYNNLLEESKKVAQFLLNGRKDLNEARIAFLVEPSFDYVALQWGIWRAGGIAVPLCTKHPIPSIEYVLEDTQAEKVIYSKAFEEFLAPLAQKNNDRFQLFDNWIPEDSSVELPEIDAARRAMIIYTSGTTGKPKGVVSTHKNIEHQITALTISWKWTQDDHVLNVLPLHHVHGIINMLGCALWSGGCCQFLPKFDAQRIFDIFCEGEVNLFMAVPTIYYKLIGHFQDLSCEEQEKISGSLQKFRLMVSGSAALPVSTLENWKKISGHVLLERYGMTEMGMAIGNPYEGTRKPGHIGQPLPEVKVRIANDQNETVNTGEQGEIQVKGPNVFKEYWQKPKETAETFTDDGWFKTGDIAIFSEGSYRILGRNSVDIIKSGGYKISALEIEETLRKHEEIKDCGVVGIADPEWGERVVAVIIPTSEGIDIEQVKNWVSKQLPSYKSPREYKLLDDLPRNVLGKVTKNDIKNLFKEKS
jgi:malonyl-CoA/methylmalonyl-CoA synthetase